MSAEISIFETFEQELEPNKSQKQLEYEELEKNSKIGGDHIWSMFEMDEFAGMNKKPDSTLPSILLKYVSNYCMPIMAGPDYSGYSVSVQSDTIIKTILNDKLYIVPVDEQFKVIGIKIPSLFLKSYNNYALVHYDHVSDRDISLSGRYGLVDLQTGKFTQQRESFTHPGLPNIGEDKVMFKSDEHTMKTCSLLIDYIDFIERYYHVNYPLLRYDLFKPDVTGTTIDDWQIINGRLSVIKPGKTAPVDMFVDFSKDLLNILKDAQNSTFGESYYLDILYMLEANKLDRLYNQAKALGATDKSILDQVKEAKQTIETQRDFQRKINEGHRIQLDIIKKKSIAQDKFGETNLLALNEKQKKIVDLEFKKLESKNTESGEKNRKLFYKLREAMTNQTPDELRRLLKEVERTNNGLEKDELLSGGVCPHTYQYAKKMSENFARASAMTELREFLINNYSLPADSAGYYCKICGEMLTEFDTTSVMKFNTDRGVQEDSPIQTMIWKEAMYIVSANVRFLTPMPVKPLVNSLAAGLKDIISHEEAKLYRSKTNLGDSIKDVLNLYSAVYIYAALCALMLQNPGKMMFAREPPAERRQFDNRNERGERNERNVNTKDDDQKEKEEKADDDQKENPKGEPAQNQKDAEKGDKSKNDTNQKEEPNQKENQKEPSSDADDENEDPIQSEYFKPKLNKSNAKLAAGTKRRRLKYVRGGKVVTDAKVAEKFYLTTALKLILLSKETIISRLPNMSVDVIKQIFIKNAYTWASKHARPIQIDDNAEKSTSENPIYTDMFYRYLYYAKKISGKPTIKMSDVDQIINKDEKTAIADTKNDIILYSNVVAPKPWKFGRDEFDQYTYESLLSMLDYYKDLVYTKSRVPRHVQVSEYLDKYKHLAEIEKKLDLEFKKSKLRPNVEIKIDMPASKYNLFAPARLDIARHYCADGATHKVGSYIYTDGKKETEIALKDILKWLTDNNTEKLEEFRKLRVIDEKCEKCNQHIRRAKSLKTSDKALAKLFGGIDDVLAFYQYYETRCPKGSLHDIQNNVCSKCSFNTEFVKSKDTKFYEKFKADFVKVQREKQSLAIKSLAAISEEAKRDKPKPSNLEYQYSLKKTAEWSQLSGLKYNLIVNIGLYENVKYVDIETAKINPSKNTTPIASRAMRLKGHIHSILRDYALILNHDNVVDLPFELKEVLDLQKKIDIKGLANSMPVIDDFNKLDTEHSSLTLENYINFLQEYLADIFVKIHSESAEKYKTLANGLIKLFSNRIIEREKFVSKPEPVFMKKEITTLEDNSEDEVGVSGDEWATRMDQSGSEVEEGEDAVETYENEISFEGFDVENADDIWENE